MTALHLMAQYLLLENTSITANDGPVQYSQGIMEYINPGSDFRFDFCGTKAEGTILVVEIFVTHRLDPIKTSYLKENKIHSIEIDLHDVDPEISKDQLTRILLHDISKQKTIYSPRGVEVREHIEDPSSRETNTSSWMNYLPIAFIGAIIYWFVRFLRRSRPKKKKYKSVSFNFRLHR